MKTFATFLLAALPTAVLAHYNFESLIVNGNVTSPYEYVRRTTNSNSPIEDVTSPNIICNAGGIDADIMAATKTMAVAAGDSVGFKVNSNLGHPGPQAVYLSKAPDGTSVQDYKGDGDWFKVYELTTSEINEQGLQWATFADGGISDFVFDLPAELPAGEYLMRAEHIALHAAGSKGGAQFYMGCAQLSVSGSGSGTPGPTVKFPGAYTGEEPGVLINIYYPAPTSYTPPGPAVWPGACEDHTANRLGATSDGDCTGSTEGGSGSGNGTSPAPVPTSSAAPAPTTTKAPASSTSAAAVPTSTPVTPAPGNGNSGNSSAPAPGSDCREARKARKARRAAARRAVLY